MTTDAPAKTDSPARPQTLRRRAEFVRAAKRGVRVSARAFSLQSAARDDADSPRFGVTVTKKVAGAVGRNRIRRRLKEALRTGGASPLGAQLGRDYVFVARRAALTLRFSDLLTQMAEGFARIEGAAADLRRKQKDRPTAS